MSCRTLIHRPCRIRAERGLEATAHFYREGDDFRGRASPGALWRESKATASRARLLLCGSHRMRRPAIHRDFAAGCTWIADVSPSVIAHTGSYGTSRSLRPVVEPVAAWMTDLRGRAARS